MQDQTGLGLTGPNPSLGSDKQLISVVVVDEMRGLPQTTQESIEARGKARLNGSSFPTPFWMITTVVLFSSTAGASCLGTDSWSIALWAHTI